MHFVIKFQTRVAHGGVRNSVQYGCLHNGADGRVLEERLHSLHLLDHEFLDGKFAELCYNADGK